MKIPDKSKKAHNAVSNEFSKDFDKRPHAQMPAKTNPKTIKTDRITLTNQKPPAV